MTGTQQKELRVKIQRFTKLLNRQPDPQDVKSRQSYSYLPISFLEMSLDELFFGQWSTYDFTYRQIVNEVVCSITLEVIHPTTGERIRRVGAASTAIMQDKGTLLTQFAEKKKKDALEMGFPKVKAEAFKNACLSFGKVFGRDLNRQFNDSYTELISGVEKDIITEVIDALDLYQGEDKETIRQMCREHKKNGDFSEQFGQGVLAKIRGE